MDEIALSVATFRRNSNFSLCLREFPASVKNKQKQRKNKRIVKENSILLFQHIRFQYNFSVMIPYIYFLLVSIDSFILTLRQSVPQVQPDLRVTLNGYMGGTKV